MISGGRDWAKAVWMHAQRGLWGLGDMGRCLAASHPYKPVSGRNRHGHSKGETWIANLLDRGSFLAGLPCLPFVPDPCAEGHVPALAHVVHGHVDSPGTKDWNQPEPAAKWSFCMLALLLVLLAPQRYLSQHWLKDMGTLEPKEGNSLQIEPFLHLIHLLGLLTMLIA